MTSPATSIRPATSADGPAIEAILAANDEPIRLANGEAPYLDHILAVARVLMAVRDGRAVGFGATVRVGQLTHLADLFVEPSSQGTGVGQALLGELYGDDWPRTTFSSDDPRAMPLYVRSGMRPAWPNLYLGADRPNLPSTSLAVSVATSDECAALELAVTGRRREARQWTIPRPGSGYVAARDSNGRMAGFGVTRERWKGPGRALDRAIVAPDADPVEVVIAILASEWDGRPLATLLPGPHPALRPLLDAGFKIVDRDTFMISEPGLVDGTRQIVDPSLL